MGGPRQERCAVWVRVFFSACRWSAERAGRYDADGAAARWWREIGEREVGSLGVEVWAAQIRRLGDLAII